MHPSSRSRIFSWLPAGRECVELCRILYVPFLSAFAQSSNGVISALPDAGVIWYVAALKFIILTLIHFLPAAQKGAPRYDGINQSMD